MAELNTLSDIFEDELRDVYDAEKQILKALPKVIKAVTSETLRDALSRHLEETRGHVERLDEVFSSMRYSTQRSSPVASASSTTKSLPTDRSWPGPSCWATTKRFRC
jgi:ferritin-like metal-binding protein YciE